MKAIYYKHSQKVRHKAPITLNAIINVMLFFLKLKPTSFFYMNKRFQWQSPGGAL